MVNSIVIICEDGPFGKNSVLEAIRMAAGILAVGDVEICKIILLKDAVYFLDNKLNPKALNINDFKNIMRLIELSELEIYIHNEALELAGINPSDLVLADNFKIIDFLKISELIIEAEMSFKY